MKFQIISASPRKDSQSIKVSKYINNCLKSRLFCKEVSILDLSNNDIPNWDQALWEDGIEWSSSWTKYSIDLQSADAFIIVVPEWGGMVPSVLKNFFQLCTNGELMHKPALIVSISSGMGGAYPIAELRMSSYKNTKICYLPEHIIIRKVEEILDKLDDYQSILNRLEHMLDILYIYAKAFINIRLHDVVLENQYPYGM